MVIEAKIIEEELDVNKIIKEIMEESSPVGGGALVLFIGFVKGKVNEHTVKELVYEAYMPYALTKLKKIVREEALRNGIVSVKVYHRIGRIEPGKPTIYIFVTATSRKIAFNVASKILERIKHEVPIFKLERRNDGEYWVIGDSERVKRKVINSEGSGSYN